MSIGQIGLQFREYALKASCPCTKLTLSENKIKERFLKQNGV